MIRTPVIAAAVASLGLLLGACTNMGPDALRASGQAIEPGLSAGERVSLASELLKQGARDKARGELTAALKTDPSNGRANRLLADMDADPQAALGDQHFAYTVRSGDTMERLAKRYLGDPLRFYILARYNGLTALDIEAGQTLMIPGVWRETPKPPAVASPPRQAATPPPPPKPAADPVQARRLRARALERMEGGDIASAVALLGQAQALDPASPLIQRDLARARRIQANVEAH